MITTETGMAIGIVALLVGVAFSFGTMWQSLKVVRRDVKEIKRDLKEVFARLGEHIEHGCDLK